MFWCRISDVGYASTRVKYTLYPDALIAARPFDEPLHSAM